MTFVAAAPERTVTLSDLDCLDSPLPAICGYPICGDGTLCGGASYISAEDCLDSPGLSIVGSFLCGQRYPLGYGYVTGATDSSLDLTPAEAL
jgi:hypothetical protein